VRSEAGGPVAAGVRGEARHGERNKRGRRDFGVISWSAAMRRAAFNPTLFVRRDEDVAHADYEISCPPQALPLLGVLGLGATRGVSDREKERERERGRERERERERERRGREVFGAKNWKNF